MNAFFQTRTDIIFSPYKIQNSHEFVIDELAKEVRFSYVVVPSQLKWFNDDCIVAVDYFNITERINVIIEESNIYTMPELSPKPTEDFQISTEHTDSNNNMKFFYNGVDNIFPLPLEGGKTVSRRLTNGLLLLTVGDAPNLAPKWYNMGFKLNGIWSIENKLSFVDG